MGGPAPYWSTYTYDTVGNRTSQTAHGSGAADTTYTYAYPQPGQAQPHAVQTITTTGPGTSRTDSYGYDASGNTTARPAGQQLAWDDLGHLASATTPAGVEGYVYGADGTLLLAAGSDGATLYLGSGEIHVDAAHHKTGTRYYTEAGKTVAQRTAAGVQYLENDDQGTQTLAVTAVSLQATKRRLDPFGNNRDAQSVAWPNDRGFVGGLQDSTTGLLRLGARDYDPATGRFVSVDPLLNPTDPQHLNPYAYSENDPTSSSDPTGLFPSRLFNDERGAQDLWHYRASLPPVPPPPPPSRRLPARLRNDERGAQSLWQSRVRAAAQRQSGPHLPARLHNDEDNAQALASYRTHLADEKAASQHPVICGPGATVCGVDATDTGWAKSFLSNVWKYRGPIEVGLGLAGFIPGSVGEGATVAGLGLSGIDAVATCLQSDAGSCGLSMLSLETGAFGFGIAKMGAFAVKTGGATEGWTTMANVMGGMSTALSAIGGDLVGAANDFGSWLNSIPPEDLPTSPYAGLGGN